MSLNGPLVDAGAFVPTSDVRAALRQCIMPDYPSPTL
jgi:hypothetical protein